MIYVKAIYGPLGFNGFRFYFIFYSKKVVCILVVIGSTVAIIEDFCFPDLTSDSPTCGSICNKWVLLVFYLLLSFVITTLFVLRVLAGRKLVELEEQYGRDEVPVQIAEQISVSFKLGITGCGFFHVTLIKRSQQKISKTCKTIITISFGIARLNALQ